MLCLHYVYVATTIRDCALQLPVVWECLVLRRKKNNMCSTYRYHMIVRIFQHLDQPWHISISSWVSATNDMLFLWLRCLPSGSGVKLQVGSDDPHVEGAADPPGSKSLGGADVGLAVHLLLFNRSMSYQNALCCLVVVVNLLFDIRSIPANSKQQVSMLYLC